MISKQLRLSNLSSKQEPVTKRRIFAFNPSLPVCAFQQENCHSRLLLSPVLLPFNRNQAPQWAAATAEVFPLAQLETDHIIFTKAPSRCEQQFEIPIYRACTEWTESEGAKQKKKPNPELKPLHHYSALQKEPDLESPTLSSCAFTSKSRAVILCAGSLGCLGNPRASPVCQRNSTRQHQHWERHHFQSHGFTFLASHKSRKDF